MSEVKDIKPYYLWNFHKDYGLIGYYDTKEEAIAEAKAWQEGTEGECDIALYKYNKHEKRYVLTQWKT